MFPYYLLIGLPILLSAFRYDDSKIILNRKFPLLVFFVTFIVLLSLRSVECGTDLLNYSNKFQFAEAVSLTSIFDLSIIEPGYELFAYICKEVTNNFQIFLS